MIVPGETFPYTPLRPKDQKWIANLCGGSPLRDAEYLRNFLTISGYSFLGSTMVRVFFDDIAWRSVQALDIDVEPLREAARVFNRGLLFYAGVTNEISKTPALPYEESVMSLVADASPKDLALDGYQRISDEVPSFCALLDGARPAMGAEETVMYQVALAGAGVLHRVVTESADLRYDMSSSMNQLYSELTDLEALFSELPPSDGLHP